MCGPGGPLPERIPAPGAVPRRIEVIRQVGHALRRVRAEMLGRPAMQFRTLVGRQSCQECLPDLVVHKHALKTVGPDPHHVANSGLVQCGDRLRRRLTGKRGGEGQVELLANHGAAAQQLHRLGRQQLQAMGQEGTCLTRGLQVGDGQRFHTPAVSIRHQRAGFEESVQHGRSHERAAARQFPDHVDGFVGQRAGHRLRQLPNLRRRKRAQSQVGLCVQTAERVVLG